MRPCVSSFHPYSQCARIDVIFTAIPNCEAWAGARAHPPDEGRPVSVRPRPGASASPVARHRSLAPAERADHVPVGGAVRRDGGLAVRRENTAVLVRGGHDGGSARAAADVDAAAAVVEAQPW